MTTFDESIKYGNLSQINQSWLETQNDTGANAVNYISETIKTDTPANISTLERTPKKDTVTFLGKEINKKKAVGFLAGAALLAVTAFAVIHKISTGKTPAEIPAEIQAKINNVIGNFIYKQPEYGAAGDKGEYTVNEILSNFVQDYDLTGRTLYHGTNLSSAQSIQKSGFVGSWRGSWMGNLGGVYLTDKHDTAEKYARQKVQMSSRKMNLKGQFVTDTKAPAEKITPAVIEVGFADGAKLAQLSDDKGKAIFDFTAQLKKSEELAETIKELTSGIKGVKSPEDLIEDFIVDNLQSRGYIGTMQYDLHTGWTQIIFDGSQPLVKNIQTFSQS